MWIIVDWTGKRLFPLHSFYTFNDGLDFIYQNVAEEDWEELCVVLKDFNENA